MKRTGIILIVTAVITATQTRADFDQANKAFTEGQYAEAASSYEALIRDHGYSVGVLFNLANTYYYDGQVGRAILNYERAQLLAPDATDIRNNLSIARRQAGIAEQPVNWLGTYALSGLCSLAAIMMAAGFLFRRVAARGGWAWIVANTIVLLAAMFALILHFPEVERGIVVVNNTAVYGTPAISGQPLFTLTEGEPISIRKTNGNFLLVEAGGATRGWVNSAAVERVIPM